MLLLIEYSRSYRIKMQFLQHCDTLWFVFLLFGQSEHIEIMLFFIPYQAKELAYIVIFRSWSCHL